ncbi:MAG: hypothetical protein AB8B49_03045 [Nitratireductor sp.]
MVLDHFAPAFANEKSKTNLYVPPEEAPHERTFMQWPVNKNVHPANAIGLNAV